MEENKKRMLIILLIFVLIVMIISATYAYFVLLVSKEEDSTKLYTGTLDVKYSQNNIIYGDMFYPRSEPESLDDNFRTYVNSFSVTNTGTLNGFITIKLDVIENGFPDGALSYRIFNGSGKVVKKGFISRSDEGDYILAKNLFLKSNKTADYTIQIWLEENERQQNMSEGKKFVAAINVIEKQNVE